MHVNSNITPLNQTYTAQSVARPDGATLFNNLGTDIQSKYSGEPLTYRNQEAHNPKLNLPQDIPKNPPMQDDSPSDAQLINEYQAAVAAGIKEKVADKQQAAQLTQAFFAKDDGSIENEGLRDMLRQIMSESREEVNAKYKKDADEPIPQDDDSAGQAAAQSMKEAEVKNQMKNYPDLYVNGKLSDKGNRLLYAIMTGGAKGDAQAEAITKAVDAKLGVSVPVDADYFNAKIGVEFEAAFQKQISGLPADQQKKMEYLFNMDPSNPDVKAFIDKATAEIQAKWGSNVSIVTENLSFTYQINGEYQLSLDKNIKTLGPQLFQNDIAAIKNYLNGGKGEISPELKAIADKAQAQTMLHMQNDFGVPKTWTPDPSINFNTFANTRQAQAYFALNDQIAASQVRLNSLPHGPERNSMASFLKKISDALTGLKEMLFQTATADASSSQQMSRAQLSLVKDKAEKAKAAQIASEAERKAAGEVAQKEAENAKKQEWMQPLMIVAGVLLSIVAVVVTAITFGAAAGLITLAIAVVILIMTLVPSGEVDGKGKPLTLMNSTMNALNKGIDEITTAMFGKDTVASQILGTLLRVAIIVVAIVISRGNLAMVAPLLITFIMESGFIERSMNDLAKASGNEKPPEWAAAIVNAVIMVAIIAAAIKTGNSGAMADKFAKLDKILGNSFVRATAAIKGAAGVAKLNVVMKVSEGLGVTAQSAVLGVRANMEIEMAGVKNTLAKRIRESAITQSKVEEIEVMIKMLQKIIDSMFGQISDLTEWAEQTGSQMDQRWADKTELLTNLNSAQ